MGIGRRIYLDRGVQRIVRTGGGPVTDIGDMEAELHAEAGG